MTVNFGGTCLWVNKWDLIGKDAVFYKWLRIGTLYGANNNSSLPD
jgi:hypothetical protein